MSYENTTLKEMEIIVNGTKDSNGGSCGGRAYEESKRADSESDTGKGEDERESRDEGSSKKERDNIMYISVSNNEINETT